MLGTAQLAGGYGLTPGSTPTVGMVREILELAREHGISAIDTAIDYGDAERLLGSAGVCDMQIVTKLRLPCGIASDWSVRSWVRDSVVGSLSRLGVSQLHSVLVHHVGDLAGPLGTQLADALNDIVDCGLSRQVGVSCYEPDDIGHTGMFDGPLTIQTPLSVLDRRFLSHGGIVAHEQDGWEWHARSVFLQGLLLLSRSDAVRRLGRVPLDLERWFRWCEDTAVSPGAAALASALGTPGVDRVVIGVETASQLREVIEWASVPPSPVPDFRSVDLDLIDPRRWPR